MRSPSTERTPAPDLAEMERWTAWVIRLTVHTASQATDPSIQRRLQHATDDAEALREALASAASGSLDAGQMDIVRSVFELWDANNERTERVASLVDPIWHRRWRIRSAGARPVRARASIEGALSEAV
jgi:hypothetical protein